MRSLANMAEVMVLEHAQKLKLKPAAAPAAAAEPWRRFDPQPVQAAVPQQPESADRADESVPSFLADERESHTGSVEVPRVFEERPARRGTDDLDLPDFLKNSQ